MQLFYKIQKNKLIIAKYSILCYIIQVNFICALLAQLDRALDYGSKG